jgi:hypothetical protein
MFQGISIGVVHEYLKSKFRNSTPRYHCVVDIIVPLKRVLETGV